MYVSNWPALCLAASPCCHNGGTIVQSYWSSPSCVPFGGALLEQRCMDFILIAFCKSVLQRKALYWADSWATMIWCLWLCIVVDGIVLCWAALYCVGQHYIVLVSIILCQSGRQCIIGVKSFSDVVPFWLRFGMLIDASWKIKLFTFCSVICFLSYSLSKIILLFPFALKTQFIKQSTRSVILSCRALLF